MNCEIWNVLALFTGLLLGLLVSSLCVIAKGKEGDE